MDKGALNGIKVLDFTWLFVGPMTTKFLGDLGATVVKIETQKRPDEARVMVPYKDGTSGLNRSLLFANYNSSKYDMLLNLNHPKGPEIFKRLVTWADIVIEAHRAGTMKRWGLQYEELKGVKPDIIMVSHTMQGQTGSMALQPVHGILFQAQLGFPHLTGWQDREPIVPPTPYSDYIAPFFVFAAIMAALDYRQRTGKGQYIDISQSEASLHFLAPVLLDYMVNGREQSRMGNRDPVVCPHGVYRCKGEDRWCAITVCTNKEWESFCRVLGNPRWTKDKRFSTILERKKFEDELDKLIERWTLNFTAEGVMEMMQGEGVAAGVVENGEDLVDKDPQLRYRHHFRELEHSEIGTYKCEAPSFKLSKSPIKIQMPAPCLGEHTEYVCKKILGMTDEEFIKLLNEGVFS